MVEKVMELCVREAEEQGLGTIALGSKMIDPPVAKQALAVLKLTGE